MNEKETRTRYNENRVAKSISTINNIFFGIIVIVAFIVILCNLGNIINTYIHTYPKLPYDIRIKMTLKNISFIPIIISIIQIIIAYIGYILLKGYAEIIFLLDKINKK